MKTIFFIVTGAVLLQKVRRVVKRKGEGGEWAKRLRTLTTVEKRKERRKEKKKKKKKGGGGGGGRRRKSGPWKPETGSCFARKPEHQQRPASVPSWVWILLCFPASSGVPCPMMQVINY